jgi:hypothetical protein
MTNPQDLAALERAAYQDAYSDGIVDLFAGLSLLWIGTAWIWLPGIAGVAGVFPAVFVSAVLAGRKRFMEDRSGYVKWSPPRRQKERRNLTMVFVAGVGLFGMGVVAFALANSNSDVNGILSDIGPGLLAFLLAGTAIGLGFMMQTRRLFLYAAVLAIAGALTAWQNASPGWPMLAAGAIVSLVGALMLVRYVRANPRTSPA